MPKLVMSWNVAGWEATLRYVKTHYKTLDVYLDRLGVDVLCLQEVKVTRAKLGVDAASLGAHLSGWDSFWACSSSKKGWNGVTTFARKGLTRSGNSRPLDDAKLDAEGRCVLTDHGSFVLFNVYAHSTGDDPDGSKQAHKLTFLRALRRRMQALRQAGRVVLLAGDLNIAWRSVDVPWRVAMVPAATLCTLLQIDAPAGTSDVIPGESGPPESAVEPCGGAASAAAAAAAAAEAAEASAAAYTAETADAAAAAAAAAAADAADAADTADAAPDAEATAVKPLGEALREAIGDAAVPIELLRRSRVPVHSLDKALSTTVPDAERSRLLRRLAHEAGESNSGVEALAWMHALFDEDGMVDPFARLRPGAVGRFSCWSQHTNGRYNNCGRRIDFILTDRPFCDAHALAGPPLVEDDTEEGARRAATARGRWQAAPLYGPMAGLPEAPQPTHDLQFVPPHSGIVYTAPHASDHVAVSLLLDETAFEATPLVLARDTSTTDCSFRPQKGMTAFFAPKAAAAAGPVSGEKRKAPGPPPS